MGASHLEHGSCESSGNEECVMGGSGRSGGGEGGAGCGGHGGGMEGAGSVGKFEGDWEEWEPVKCSISHASV